MNLLWVGIGGFVGAVLRYGTSHLVQTWAGDRFPGGTLAVNVLGCLMLGALLGIAGRTIDLPEHLRLLVAVGLLGSFTTFSTFAKEAVDLYAVGQPVRALLVVLLNLVIGFTAVWLGARITG